MNFEPIGEKTEATIQEKIAKKGRFAGERIVNPKTPERTEDVEDVRKQIERHRKAGGKIFYEVGFGGFFCIGLKKYDLSIGVDPMFSRKTTTHGLNEDEMYSERVFFNQQISELPEDEVPDVVLMVAPSPHSIEDMLGELESKVDTRSKFIFVIENQSFEAAHEGGSEKVIAAIGDFLHNIGKTSWHIDREPENLVLGLDNYFDDIDISRQCELNTSPWEITGKWKVVTVD